jgi:protein-tyrosine phosphatase
VLDLIDRERGGLHQYLLDAGLDELELAKLRSALVEPA